jgi:DNA sulfur modification protein DndC
MGIGQSVEKSVFEYRAIRDIYSEIRDVYRRYPQPWVIGYSGGKDSTTVLQLVWNAIKELPPEERQKPIFVIASDTKVETPVIVDYIDNTLRRVNEAALEQGMPFSAEKVMPTFNDSFWVNLIGRGCDYSHIFAVGWTHNIAVNRFSYSQKLKDQGRAFW